MDLSGQLAYGALITLIVTNVLNVVGPLVTPVSQMKRTAILGILNLFLNAVILIAVYASKHALDFNQLPDYLTFILLQSGASHGTYKSSANAWKNAAAAIAAILAGLGQSSPPDATSTTPTSNATLPPSPADPAATAPSLSTIISDAQSGAQNALASLPTS